MLKFMRNPQLYEMIHNNQLTTLDISNNKSLSSLSCHHNQLTTLDVSNQLGLVYFMCGYNQLTSLDISNNSGLGVPGSVSLGIDFMPSLQKVCVWTLPFPPEVLSISTDGSPNVYFTTDCN